MPRPLRKCYQNVTYHCCSRCIERRDLLSSEYIKNVAVTVINAAHEKYDFKLVQIEFVENHLHILIKTTKTGETISRIMQYIKARIAEHFNRAYSRIGPFWNERFKSKIIEEADDPQSYFLYLMWYIAYNPVRKRVIGDPRESKYGTIRSYLEADFIPKVTITFHEYFINLGDNFTQRVNAFLKYEIVYLQRFV
jgi:REP element-mobilizing transposase RayT